jgi:putative transposase
MPRALRVEYPRAMYHVMDRGDHQERIFLDDVDRQDWLKTLAEACQKTGWQVHAYCLMSNHFHAVLETPNANLHEMDCRTSAAWQHQERPSPASPLDAIP